MKDQKASGPMRPGTAVQFGELILTFTTSYDYRYNDRGSGAGADGSFWHPKPPEGFHALGSIGYPGYDGPEGRFASVVARAADPNSSNPPLKAPEGYDQVWNDSGSGADDDGSCWRPRPPDGYVALGDVFVRGYDAPGNDQMMCVRKDLVFQGATDWIWDDRGSGAHGDFMAWQVGVSRAYRGTADGLFAANTFVSASNYDGNAPASYTLRLPLPFWESGEPVKPTLTSRTKPDDHTTPLVDRIVTVPFTAIIDNDRDLRWQVENSPFYEVRRAVFYDLVLFDDNTTSSDQVKTNRVTTGVTKEVSENYSIKTGIKVTYESGVQAGAFSSKVAVELSIELGYSYTTTHSEFRSEEVGAELRTPAQHAAALWIEANTFQLFRNDDTPVSDSMSFNAGNTAFLTAQYPVATSAGPQVLTRRTARSGQPTSAPVAAPAKASAPDPRRRDRL